MIVKTKIDSVAGGGDIGLQCISLKVVVNRHKLFMDVTNIWLGPGHGWARTETKLQWGSREPKKRALRSHIEQVARQEGEKFFARLCRRESVNN